MAKEEKEEIEVEEKKKEGEKEEPHELMKRPKDLFESDWFPMDWSDWMDRPITEMDRVFDEFDRTFRKYFGSPLRRRRRMIPEFRRPVLDIQDRKDHYLLEAELPGVSKDDINVEIEDDKLSIKTEQKKEKKEEGEGYVRHERGYRSFYREIALPDDIITDKIKGELKNGILNIKMPKKEQEKKEPKKVEIK